jgi:glycosyltransferase involved in cell wall biosynthesis
MTPLSLLHVNTERGWRGGEAQTLLLARGLEERGHRCRLAVAPGSPLEQCARQEGIQSAPLAAQGELDPGAIIALARMLRRFRPDLVHYHTSHAVTLGTLASFFAGRRAAVATRRVSFPLSRNPLARIKYTFRLDRVIAVSEGIRETLATAGVPKERITVVHSAVDLRRFDPPPHDRQACRRELGYAEEVFVVGCAGHLAEHKGHRVLVEAAGRLGEFPGMQFLLIGKGEKEEELRKQIAGLGLDGKFRLVGFREGLESILPALDLLAFPSLSGEGSPAVLKEAMACGLPVVASAISGVEEVVRQGSEGLLVPPGDPAALAQAIRFFAADRERGLEFGGRGRERSREFRPERMVEMTEKVYREVLPV